MCQHKQRKFEVCSNKKTKKNCASSELDWLVSEVNKKGKSAEKTIIFCNTMNEIAVVQCYQHSKECSINLPGGITFGTHPLITRFLKGVFTARSALPWYKEIRDVSVVLDYRKTLSPLETLSLKNITHKTVMLVALLSGQRCQTIHALTISGMKLHENKYTRKQLHVSLTVLEMAECVCRFCKKSFVAFITRVPRVSTFWKQKKSF